MKKRSNLLPLSIFIALALSLTAAGHEPHDPQQIRISDEDVWVKWSVASNLHSERELENGTINFKAGYSSAFGFIVYNNHSEPVTNVTLVPVVHGADINVTLHATYAGDPPQGFYAFWHEIPENGGKLVTASFKAPMTTGDYTLAMVVLFEDGNGTQRVGKTTYEGAIIEPPVEVGPLDATGGLQSQIASDFVQAEVGLAFVFGAGAAWGASFLYKNNGGAREEE